jgi:hypothetical protein
MEDEDRGTYFRDTGLPWRFIKNFGPVEDSEWEDQSERKHRTLQAPQFFGLLIEMA